MWTTVRPMRAGLRRATSRYEGELLKKAFRSTNGELLERDFRATNGELLERDLRSTNGELLEKDLRSANGSVEECAVSHSSVASAEKEFESGIEKSRESEKSVVPC